ncbi:MAG: hypothetical protein ABIQ77_01120 [Anaerolineales bacterium]
MRLQAFRQWVAVLFVVFTSLVSGYYSFFVNPPTVLIQRDGAANWEERMQPIREHLPATIREVGYVSDLEDTALIQEYSLTRYALAPVVVRTGAEFEWIIGNFTQPGFESILNEQIASGYTIEKLGFGIYLIHRILP